MSVGFRPTEPSPQRPPRETLFEFHANHKFFRAELLDRGRWGIEAQIIEAPDARTRPRRSGPQADRRAVAHAPQPTRNGPEPVIRSLPLPPCVRCRRLTGVEEDDSAGSSLRWFVCRLCGHRWSVAPKKLR